MLSFKIKRFKYEFVIAAAIVILLSIILMIRPIIGVADNGDFARIMNSTGLHHLSEEHESRYFGYVNRQYGIGYIVPFGGGYISTEIPMVICAIMVSKVFTADGLFDIRFLGSMYVALLALAAFFTVRSSRKWFGATGIIVALVYIIIFCDTGYTSYFNSLYGEPVTFVFMLLMASMAMTIASEEKPAIWMLLLFGSAAFFFAGAKVQNSPGGILSLLLFIRLVAMRRDRIWRRVAMGSAAAVILISIICYISVSRDIKICNKYQTVFFGILKGSENPSRDLEELGLDPSLEVLAGTNYFMDDYPLDIRSSGFRTMIDENVDHFKIVAYYLRHPKRFIEKMSIAAGYGFKLSEGMGNFEKSPEITYKQVTKDFNRWSDFKLNVMPHTIIFVAAFYGMAFLIMLYEYSRASSAKARFMVEYFGFVVLTGMIQFVLPVVGDGEADLSKHLFMFNLCFDMLFSAAFAYIAIKLVSIVKWVNEKRRLSARLQSD